VHYKSLQEYITTSEIGESWRLLYIRWSDNGSTITQAIVDGDTIALSDGSFEAGYGMAAWVIEGVVSIGRITGTEITPGLRDQQSPYW
jgi:hypothetical protein